MRIVAPNARMGFAELGLFSGIASIFGGGAQKKASRAAEQAQLGYLTQALDYTKAQNATGQANLDPYLTGGEGALGEILNLLGISSPGTQGQVNWGSYVSGNPDLAQEWQRIQHEGRFANASEYGQWHYENYGKGENRDLSAFSSGGLEATDGDTAQARAIAELEASPLFQSLIRNGEEGILQNAAATGGLRGGNTQRGLAEFRADTLTQTIENQLQRLGGLTGAGLTAATASGAMGAGSAKQVSEILGQQGQVRSGGLLTRGGITAAQMGNVGGILDSVTGDVTGGIKKGVGSILKGIF